jgi:hypothetical protein
MFFDICTINIGVSIRGRGLHLVVDTFCFRRQKQKRYCCSSILVLLRLNGLLGSGFYMPMFPNFVEFSVNLYTVSLEACRGKQAQDGRSVEEDEVDE